VRGIEFVAPSRPDECCGFGGTFSIFEEPVSAKMGYDKVADHHDAGAKYIVSADMSCLMHQKGCAERLGLDIRFIHIAQILNGDRA
jgi:L-lactate dehydrogenase complex protein LldE